MRNDVQPATDPAPKPAAAPPPLVILATDEDAVCAADLCLPAALRDARDRSDEPRAAE